MAWSFGRTDAIDTVSGAWCEIGVPFSTPFAAGEGVPAHDVALGRIGVGPVLVVAGFPAAMGRDEHANTRRTHRRGDRTKIVQQAAAFRDGLNPGPDPAALGEKIVVGVDEQQRGFRVG